MFISDGTSDSITIKSVESSTGGTLFINAGTSSASSNREINLGGSARMNLAGTTELLGGIYNVLSPLQISGPISGSATLMAQDCSPTIYGLIDILGVERHNMKGLTIAAKGCPIGLGGYIVGINLNMGTDSAIVPTKLHSSDKAYIFPREITMLYSEKRPNRVTIEGRGRAENGECVIELSFDRMRDSLHHYEQLENNATGIYFRYCDVTVR